MTTIDRDRLPMEAGAAPTMASAMPEERAAQAPGWMQALADACGTGSSGFENADGASAASVRLWESIGDRLALGALALPADAQSMHAVARSVETPRATPAPAEHSAFAKATAEGLSGQRLYAAGRVRLAAARAPAVVDMGESLASPAAGMLIMRDASVRASVPGHSPAAGVQRQRGNESSSSFGLPSPLPPAAAPLPAALRRVMWRAAAATGRQSDAGDDRVQRRGFDAAALARSSTRWLRRVTHAYAGADGITLWLRDGRLEAGDLRRIVGALSRWASSVGVTLAAVVCNGKVVYRNVRSGDAESASKPPRQRQPNPID